MKMVITTNGAPTVDVRKVLRGWDELAKKLEEKVSLPPNQILICVLQFEKERSAELGDYWQASAVIRVVEVKRVKYSSACGGPFFQQTPLKEVAGVVVRSPDCHVRWHKHYWWGRIGQDITLIPTLAKALVKGKLVFGVNKTREQFRANAIPQLLS